MIQLLLQDNLEDIKIDRATARIFQNMDLNRAQDNLILKRYTIKHVWVYSYIRFN